MSGGLRAELLKLWRRPAVWVLGLLWVAMAVVFGYVIPYVLLAADAGQGGQLAVGTVTDLLPRRMVENALPGFPLFGGAITLILGGLAAGSEYTWGTLTTMLTQGPRRLTVLTAKLLALGVLSLALTLAAFLAGVVSSSVIALLEGESLGWPSGGRLTLGVGVGTLILALFAVLGALLAIVLRGPAVAIGVGLVYLLAVEPTLAGLASQSSVVDDIQRLLPGSNAGSLAAAFVTEESQSTPGIVEVAGPTEAALMVAGYAVACVALAALLTQRRDVT